MNRIKLVQLFNSDVCVCVCLCARVACLHKSLDCNYDLGWMNACCCMREKERERERERKKERENLIFKLSQNELLPGFRHACFFLFFHLKCYFHGLPQNAIQVNGNCAQHSFKVKLCVCNVHVVFTKLRSVQSDTFK